MKALLVLLIALPAVAQVDPEARLQERLRIIRQARPHKHQKEASDFSASAYFLEVDANSLTRNIRQLDMVRSIRLNSSMWSGYFWPNYQGGIANRWADPAFPRTDWGKARSYTQSRPASSISNDLLSPAEKYDLIMGVAPEEPGSLTSQQWNMSANEYASTGQVLAWQGICNGWAPASINFPVPYRPVTFHTRRGDITFSSNDIKALGSLLYATGRFESSYVGFRCNTDAPARERDGRVITPECFDVNPAEWHVITTHHIGFNHRPFIIDTMQSSQVWNKPVIGYSFGYFNPRYPGRLTYSVDEGLAPVQEVRNTRGTAHSSPRAVWVLGVTMTMTHLEGGFTEINVNNTKDMVYRYTLELDRDLQIVGGEWQTDDHPDFAWKPRYMTLPTTDGDSLTNNLNAWEAAMDSRWRDAALKSNAQGTPLTKFVKYLFDYSGSSN